MALYDHTFILMYVFSVLCSIFQYIIKQWLRVLQLSMEAEYKKVMPVAYEYAYQEVKG